MVEGLQEMIDNCIGKIKIPLEHRIVMKLGKHKKRTWHKMRLAVEIREYEKDQVILDLGSNEMDLRRHGKGWGDLHYNGLLYSYAWPINRRSFLWGACMG